MITALAAVVIATSPVIPPAAWVEFCGREPAQCERRGDGNTVDLSAGNWHLIRRVNLDVNRQITHRADNGDKWCINVAHGDCEDYALTKRYRLMAQGWPSGALRIATGVTPEGVGHAVLIVSTNRGDLVLNSRIGLIRTVSETDVVLHKIQSQLDPQMMGVSNEALKINKARCSDPAGLLLCAETDGSGGLL